MTKIFKVLLFISQCSCFVLMTLFFFGCAANKEVKDQVPVPQNVKKSPEHEGVPLPAKSDSVSQNKTQTASKQAGPARPSVSSGNSYLIGPEDVIDISVWKNADISKIVTVRPDGQVSLPLIGDVKAVGLTPAELREIISNRLKEYQESPIVSVIVQEINSYNVFVMGEVAHPGKFRLKSNTTLLQALSLAGGFTPYASRNKIVILRKDLRTLSATEMQIRYDDIVKGKEEAKDPYLVPGDTVVVP
jgi:polysaccharide export outer membrane protein